MDTDVRRHQQAQGLLTRKGVKGVTAEKKMAVKRLRDGASRTAEVTKEAQLSMTTDPKNLNPSQHIHNHCLDSLLCLRTRRGWLRRNRRLTLR